MIGRFIYSMLSQNNFIRDWYGISPGAIAHLLAYACLAIILTADGTVAQTISVPKNAVPTNFLLLKKKKNIVFLSSTAHAGNLGGLTGADRICQDLAAKARLPGTYMAWLSDSNRSPATRFKRSALPYVLTDGTRIASDWNDLTDGYIDAPINIDENKQAYSSGMVWTHTRADGIPYDTDHNCDDWTAAVPAPPALDLTMSGYLNTTGGSWSSAVISWCNSELQLYCFQQ